MSATTRSPEEQESLRERVSAWFDLGLAVLALVMLALLIVELADIAPSEWQPRVVQASTAIWAIFLVAFLVELWLAPSKLRYLRQNWIVLLSLALPFLRILRVGRAVRVLRAARVLRGVALGRTLGALNRARNVLLSFAASSQFAYLTLLAVLVTVTAAAAVFYFERDQPASDLDNFGEALWWATTLVTTVGSEHEAETLEGRIVSLLLRIFGVAVIGYFTARLAVFLLGRDAASGHPATSRAASEATPDIDVRALQAELRRLADALDAREERTVREATGEQDASGQREP